MFGFSFLRFLLSIMCFRGRGIRFAVWNAHSVNNKRAEVKFLLHDRELDVLCIYETWLAEDDVFESYGYLTYRCDHPGGGRGGCVILARNRLCIFPVSVDGSWCARVDVVAFHFLGLFGGYVGVCPAGVG